MTASRLFRAISQPFQDVRARARFFQFKLGAAGDDRLAVLDEDLQGTLERQQARFAVHQRQHLHAKGGLQGGVFVELVEHLLGLRAALQLDDDAHAAPVGFVAQVRDLRRSCHRAPGRQCVRSGWTC